MKRTLLVLCFYFSAAAALALCGASPLKAEEVKLTYSNFFPAMHVQSKLAEA